MTDKCKDNPEQPDKSNEELDSLEEADKWYNLKYANETKRLLDLENIDMSGEIRNILSSDELKIVWMLRHMPLNMTKIYLKKVQADFTSVTAFLASYRYLNNSQVKK